MEDRANKANWPLAWRPQELVTGQERPATRYQRWISQAEAIRREVRIVWLIFKDRRTPWHARLIAACAAGYIFSPIQVIPSFIPVIGFLDDFIVLSLGVKLMKRLTPAAVIDECCERAAEPSVSSAPRTRETRFFGACATVLIVVIWLLAAAVATVWLWWR
ncbi:MAG TPA: YkvA family protein [Candidatus Angelobacter sp.]|nr:YkvA family protein [Candidatus Angelobacter sp.]